MNFDALIRAFDYEEFEALRSAVYNRTRAEAQKAAKDVVLSDKEKHLANVHKIGAIRAVRDRCPRLDLYAAKEVVERYLDSVLREQ